MKLLSLDVGFASMGWAVMDNDKPIDCGTIKTQKSARKTTRTADDYFARARILSGSLVRIIKKHDVKGIVGELPTGGAQSARAMQQMAMATALVAAISESCNLPAEWATPNEVKMAVCGYRSATKDEMMDAIRKRYPDTEFPKTKSEFEHVADAVGAYISLESSGCSLILMAKQLAA